MPSKLIELEIPRPGIFGVNTSASGDVMPKEYSVQSSNLVFSDEGYPEARRGSTRTTASTLQTLLSAGASQTVRTIYHTTDENGADLTIASTESYIFKISGGTVTNITGTITAVTTGNWKFVNLNDKIIGFQPGEVIIELTTPSTGSFADVTFTATGSETPAGDGATNALDVLAAAGRLWVLDGSTLRYSSLLDHTDFSTTSDTPAGDAGAFDLNAVRLNGEDLPIGLTEFNGNILVFFERHIVVYAGIWNPNGDATDQPPMEMIENISGVGCIARDSVQHTQNDCLFLSEQGITSLSRVVQEKSMPLNRFSDNIRREVNKLVKGYDLTGVWSVYFEGKGLYIFGHPDDGTVYLLDVKNPLPDGSYRATTWNKAITTMGVSPQRTLVASDTDWKALWISDEANYLSQVDGFRDYRLSDKSGGSTYDIVYESAWTAIVDEYENYVKIPKKLYIVLKGGGDQAFTINLAFDYGSYTDAKAKTGTVSLALLSLYGSAVYGTGQYGSGTAISTAKAPGFGSGRIMRVKLQATVGVNGLALQRISILSKLGRQQ